MTISDVRIREVQSQEGKLRAVASFTIDECFAVHDIKILEREDGYCIAMPNRKTTNGAFKDIAHPLNNETRERLCDAILQAYAEMKS